MLAVAGCATSTAPSEQMEAQLRFKDGKFKVIQFTDIHWGWDVNPSDVRSNIMGAAEAEKPQLLVFTGDLITGAGDLSVAKAEWTELLSIADATGVPYAVVMGNHDAECCDGMCADTIETWVSEIGKNCINYPSEHTEIFGHGNKTLPVYSEKGDKVSALVYVLDSNDYPLGQHSFASHYDWIHPDQVAWYIEESNKYKAQNGGDPLPALAYYHICVPEYNIVKEVSYYGHYLEPCCPGEINTGFFSAAYFQGDIMGMFVGHDHTNDYCLVHKGIALCYGRQSGVAGMDPNTPRGCRVVEMTEGVRGFRTWVRTEAGGAETSWLYPAGISADAQVDMKPAQDIEVAGNGVKTRYFEGTAKDRTVDQMTVEDNFKSESVTPGFDIDRNNLKNHFGYIFDTWFLAENDGVYRFDVNSDDGSVLFVDDEKVIDLDGSHSADIADALVGLKKGYHHIVVKYFDDSESQTLDIDVNFRPIPESLLFVKK